MCEGENRGVWWSLGEGKRREKEEGHLKRGRSQTRVSLGDYETNS